MTTYHIKKDTAGFVKGISKNGTDLKEGFIRKELMNKEYSEMQGIVIAKGEKYYTNLEKTFKLLGNIQKNYNWLITAYECYPKK